jgi:hypothetical protein
MKTTQDWVDHRVSEIEDWIEMKDKISCEMTLLGLMNLARSGYIAIFLSSVKNGFLNRHLKMVSVLRLLISYFYYSEVTLRSL